MLQCEDKVVMHVFPKNPQITLCGQEKRKQKAMKVSSGLIRNRLHTYVKWRRIVKQLHLSEKHVEKRLALDWDNVVFSIFG